MATSKLQTGVSYFTTLAHLGEMCYKQFHNLAEDVESWCFQRVFATQTFGKRGTHFDLFLYHF